MAYVAYGLAALAILAMGINVILAIRLRRAIVGGEVGAKWGLLTVLIAVFFGGYLLSPLAIHYRVPAEYMHLLVSGVFLLGAVFVWVVMGIVRDTLTFLKLLKE